LDFDRSGAHDKAVRGAARWFWKSLILAAVWASACGAGAAEPASGQSERNAFLRAIRRESGTVALETAIRKLEPSREGLPIVYLVSVVHIGDSNYYAALQRFLDRQPLVLFEGIGAQDKDFGVDQGYSLQNELAKALGLTFQLAAIDYKRPNFENCDLTLAQLLALFQASPAPKGKEGKAGAASSQGKAEFQALLQAMEGAGFWGGLARIGVNLIGSSPRLRAAVKVALAETLGDLPEDLEAAASISPGMARLMQALLSARNEAVLKRIARELRAPRPPKSIAVFYGAGHIPLLSQAICARLGYRPAGDMWRTAFKADPQAAGLSRFEVELLRGMIRFQFRQLRQAARQGQTAQSPGQPDKTQAKEAKPSAPSKAVAGP